MVINFLLTFKQYFRVLFLIKEFLLCVAGLVSLKLYVVFLLVVPLLLHALYRLVNPATKQENRGSQYFIPSVQMDSTVPKADPEPDL